MVAESQLRWPDPALTAGDSVLRPWRAEDAPQLVRAWSDADIVRWNPVPPAADLDAATRWISGRTDRLQRGLALDLALVDDDVVVGEVGLSGFDRPRRAALIGYWLLPAARGRGLATAAVRMVTEWAHSELDLVLLVARCDVDNVVSHRVAERAGYVFARSDGDGHDLWVSRA